MTHPFRQLLNGIMPIVSMILFVALFVIGIFIFSYIIIIAAMIGLVLFSIAYIRAKLLIRKRKNKSSPKKVGRVIEHDE